jgi:serine/threonine-protein kinase
VLEDTVPIESVEDSPDLEPGTEVAGYVIDAKIGQGGMGKVYGAHHPRIGKKVAIKVLERSYCNDASAVARFEQEARLVNEIRHPNIVDVFQFGELSDKRSFFVMELLSGETLSDRIESGPLTIRETVEILDTICDALEAAHEQKVIHRDLKSDNVFLASTRGKSTVKLLDFGIAKLGGGRTDLASIGKTATGIVVGTPAYMSPEQARGQAVGPRTDVYQLGVLAYKMLTRQLPFQAENPFELIVQQLKAPPPSPKKLAPKTPDVLARLVVRMMAKTPEERPSVSEIRDVFAQMRAGTARKPAPSRANSVLIGLALFMLGGASLGVFLVLERNKEHAATQVAPAATPPAPAPAPAPVSGSNAAAPIPPAPSPAPASPPTPVVDTAAVPIDPAIEIEPPAPPPAAPAATTDGVGDTGADSDSSSHHHRRHATDADDQEDEEAAAAAAAEADDSVPPDRPGAILFTLALDCEIAIDGRTVASSSKKGRYEVPPGTHQVRVKAPGHQAVTRSVDVLPGGVAIISIEVDDAPSE